jgi:cyclic beta-1,2-glucan synthetase
MTSAAVRKPSVPLLSILAGAILIACAVFASLSLQSWILAGVAGAAGLALWRYALIAKPLAPINIAFDAAAFAIFAIMRNDAMGFWQLPGPWSDVPHFNATGAVIAYAIYVVGTLAALLSRYRGLRSIEALGLVGIPFLFNLVMTLGADWHMQELGAWLSPDVPRTFQGQVAIGRIAIIFVCAEALLFAFSIVGTGRPQTQLKLHLLMFVGAVLAALTPLLANFAQIETAPLLAIGFSAILAAFAQAGLWSVIYLMTGLTLDLLGGRPPTFVAAYGHWRTGAVKGAIYGGVFMFLLLALHWRRRCASPSLSPS